MTTSGPLAAPLTNPRAFFMSVSRPRRRGQDAASPAADRPARKGPARSRGGPPAGAGAGAGAGAERHLDETQRLAKMGSWEHDLKTGELRWSPGLFQLLGWDPRRVAPSEEDLLAAVHPRDRVTLERARAAAARTGAPYVAEFRLRQPDGGARWVQERGQAILDPAGRPVRWVAMVQDIAARQLTQEAAHRVAGRMLQAQKIGRFGDWEVVVEGGRPVRATWSPVVHDFLGLPHKRAPQPGDLFGAVHPEDRPWVEPLLDRTFRARRLSFRATFRLVSADGVVRWVDAIARRSPGMPVRYVGFLQDVTERVAAEEGLRLMASILEGSRDGVLSLALDGTVRLWSAGAEHTYGWSAEEAVGRNFLDLAVLPERTEEFRALLRQVAEGRRVEEHETEQRRKDGSRATVAVTMAPLHDPLGRVIGASSVAHDISERQRAAEVHRLQEMNRFRMEFLNAAAHELNTPLTPLTLELNLLASGKQGPLNPKQAHTVEMLERNLGRVRRLVRDLLDSARLESGRLELVRKPVDLDALAREAGETFRASAEAEGVVLEVAPGGAGEVPGDEVRLMQVVTNLVGNALRATPRGGRVTVATRGGPGEAVLEVRDTGVGLTEAQRALLFRPFTQVHDPLPGKSKGTGLGLYISQGIVTQHSGRMWCASDGPGQGSTFGFALPREAKADAEAPAPAPAAKGRAGQRSGAKRD